MADEQIQLSRALGRLRRSLARGVHKELVTSVVKGVNHHMTETGGRTLVNVYVTDLQQMLAASMQGTLKNLPQQAQRNLLGAGRLVEEATIGATPAAREKNAEIIKLMEDLASDINAEILEQYIEAYGDSDSYREGDPARRSGGIERFLRKNVIAEAEGHVLTVSLDKAVNDDDVPHIFRLNYGTRSLVGGEKAGNRPPHFSISLVPGAPTRQRELSAPRRPGFYYPGGPFRNKFILTVGGNNSVQLNSRRGTRIGIGNPGQMYPSQGIAPTYFVEYGLAEALAKFPHEFQQKVLHRWRQRIKNLSQ